MLLVAGGVLLYGMLQLTECVGLWLMKRWGEYAAAVATTIFIPLEIYELAAKVTWLRVGAERRNDSLLEVEQSAGNARP